MRVSVGLVVNPSASRDVRRLTSLARTVDIHERVNVVARVLRGLAAMTVDDVFYMVEPYHVVERAWAALASGPASAGRVPSLRPAGGGEPAVDAGGTALRAAELAGSGVACVISVGGDGTHRAVAAGWPGLVLAPLAGGTNNAFAASPDPTVVGLAAGLFAAEPAAWARHAQATMRLDVAVDAHGSTGALVDVALVDEAWIGAHAVWDGSLLREAVVARSDPTVSGLAGLAGMVHPIAVADRGLHLRFGEGAGRCLAPLGPGQLDAVAIETWRELEPGDEVVVGGGRRGVLAFDGEREIVLQPDQQARVRLLVDGPRTLDAAGLVREAAEQGAFMQPHARGSQSKKEMSDADR